MSHSVKLSDELYSKAQHYSMLQNRSIPKQIEYWAKIGRMLEENPDLTYSLLRDILLAKTEAKNGEVAEYKFGKIDEKNSNDKAF